MSSTTLLTHITSETAHGPELISDTCASAVETAAYDNPSSFSATSRKTSSITLTSILRFLNNKTSSLTSSISTRPQAYRSTSTLSFASTLVDDEPSDSYSTIGSDSGHSPDLIGFCSRTSDPRVYLLSDTDSPNFVKPARVYQPEEMIDPFYDSDDDDDDGDLPSMTEAYFEHLRERSRRKLLPLSPPATVLPVADIIELDLDDPSSINSIAALAAYTEIPRPHANVDRVDEPNSVFGLHPISLPTQSPPAPSMLRCTPFLLPQEVEPVYHDEFDVDHEGNSNDGL